MEHVVWDWNGTLLADQQLVVDALNVTLAEFALGPLTLEAYQRVYTRPVHVMYERLFGRDITDDEWARIDDAYHHEYARALAGVRLADDAEEALDRVLAHGRTQSLLSMYRHHELLPLVNRLGVRDRFVTVEGLTGPGGGRKARYLEAHVLRISDALHEPPSHIVIVGDALDDAEAAAHVGARAVLYDGGSHAREELEHAGVPVAGTLTEALDIAGLPS